MPRTTASPRAWLASAALALAFVAALTPVSAAPAAGPELRVGAERLRTSLDCPARNAHPNRDPVLLVHGTATDAWDSWSWGYMKALPKAGFDTCAVDLPALAMNDIQLASEFVVFAIRRMAARWDRDVDVIGHSQGNLEPRWAMKWWPDVRAAVDDYISFAGPHHGALGADLACSGGECAPAAWQQRHGSRFLAKLNSGDETPAGPSYTSVYTQFDELVQPPSTATLRGGSNIRIQDVCPARPVTHMSFLWDAATFEIALDALRHPGPARPARIGPLTCLRYFMPGAELPEPRPDIFEHALEHFITYSDTWSVHREPALAPYAR